MRTADTPEAASPVPSGPAVPAPGASVVQRTSARVDGRAYAYLRLLQEQVRTRGTCSLGPGASPHLERSDAPLTHAAVIGAALRALLCAQTPELVAALDRLPEAELTARLEPLLRAMRVATEAALDGADEHDSRLANALALLTPTPTPETTP